jgi:hypothetical protein
MRINQKDYKIQVICNKGCEVVDGNKKTDEFAQKDIIEKLNSILEDNNEILLNGKFRGFQSLLTKIKKAGYKVSKTNVYDEDYLPYNMVLAVISK